VAVKIRLIHDTCRECNLVSQGGAKAVADAALHLGTNHIWIDSELVMNAPFVTSCPTDEENSLS
jgi:hypothetical protein